MIDNIMGELFYYVPRFILSIALICIGFYLIDIPDKYALVGGWIFVGAGALRLTTDIIGIAK